MIGAGDDERTHRSDRKRFASTPSDAVGRVWMLRGPGMAIAPMRGATVRITNVSRNVTTAAIPATVR